jgi:hypothetical protein
MLHPKTMVDMAQMNQFKKALKQSNKLIKRRLNFEFDNLMTDKNLEMGHQVNFEKAREFLL